jgi:tetratricopeptide (TPR) repeat protein/spermidine synthase
MLLMERLWSRLLTLVLGHDTYGFASMLVTAILGLSIGGAVAGFISARGRSTLGWGAAMLMAAGASALGCFWFTAWLLERSAGDPFGILAASALATTPSMGLVHPLALSLLPALLPSVAAGAVFPLACAAVDPHPSAAGSEVGRITAFNAAGCVLGALLPTVGLVGWLGVHGSVAAGAAMATVAGAVVLLRAVESGSLAIRASAAAGLGAVALMIAVTPAGTVRKITNVMVGGRVEQIVYHAEGRTGTVTVTRNRIDGVRTLFVNAVNEVTTRYVHDQSFSLLGHLGPLVHPSPKTGLVICHGAGLTASAVATHETMEVTVVDLEQRVVEASREFSDLNGNLHENPRVEVLVEDGRNHLLATKEFYDVITVDSTHPRAVDSWVLYTTQFYSLARSRLSEDGVIVQWIPLHGMSEDEFRILVNTFLEIFPQAQLWANVGYDRVGFTGYALMVAGASGDVVLDVDRISSRMRAPAVRDEMSRWGLSTIADVLDCFIAGPRRLDRWTDGLPVNTDDRPLTPWVTGWSRGRRMGPHVLSSIAEPIGDLLVGPASGAEQLEGQLAKHRKAEGLLLRGEAIRAAEVIPDNPRLGRYVTELNDAIAYNRELAAAQNEDHRSLLAAGTALDELGDHRSALEVLRRAASLEPGDARTWLRLGLSYAHMGRNEDAERAYERVLGIVPDSALGLDNMALAVMAMGDPYEATEVLRDAARADPSFHRTWLYLGQAHMQRGEPQIALDHLDTAARLVDSDPQVHHLRGRALAELGDWPSAIEAFDRAIELDPWWFAPHYERGLALLATSDFENARISLERAVDIDPHSGAAWTDLGLALAGQGMWAEAAQAHLTATDQDDELARAWLNLGLALKALGEMQTAEAAFRKALSIDPEIAGR